MIVTRIGPTGEVQPALAAVPVRAVGPGSLDSAPVPPPGPRPLDAAAALRILYEEVRTALAARAGSLLDEVLTRMPGAVGGPDRTDLGRLFAAFVDTAGPVASDDGQTPWQVLLAALDEGYDRSLAHLQRLPGTPAAATTIIEHARDELVRTLESSASAAKAPPPQLARAFGHVLAGFTSAVEDRVGALPPGLVPAYEGGEPAESVLALTRALQFVARDPAFAMRATPSVLEAAVNDGAMRAALALAQLTPGSPIARDLVEDLRVILARSLRAGEPPALPGPRSAAMPPAPATAAGGASPPAGSVLARPVQAFVAELTRAVAEATGRAPPSIAPITDIPDPPAGAAVALLAATRLLAPLAAGDPLVTRTFLLGEFDAAARRVVLQLPSGGTFEPSPRALLAEVTAVGARLLAAAETAATLFPGDARAFVRLVSEAALALLRGQEPPFRLDLAPWRGPRAARRRMRGDAGIDGIESTDAGDEQPPAGDDSVGAALAEFAKGK